MLFGITVDRTRLEFDDRAGGPNRWLGWRGSADARWRIGAPAAPCFKGGTLRKRHRVSKTQNLAAYAGKWVVLSPTNRVVAAGFSLSEVVRKLPPSHSRTSPSVFLVPRRDEGPYVLVLFAEGC